MRTMVFVDFAYRLVRQSLAFREFIREPHGPNPCRHILAFGCSAEDVNGYSMHITHRVRNKRSRVTDKILLVFWRFFFPFFDRLLFWRLTPGLATVAVRR